MAYRAEIEIGVKGAKKLEQFKQSLERISNRIDDLNKQSISIQRIKDYVNNLNLAADTLKEVAAGTKEETTAIRNYARALTENNAVQQRQNRLLGEQVQKFQELQRVQRQATGFSAAKYGPQVPEGFDAVKKAAETRTKIAEDASIKEINKRRVEERRLLSDLIDGDLKRIKANGQANEKAFDEFINENKKALADFDKRLDRSIRTRSQQLKKSFKDAAGSAIIGGAFPLLFGQGAGAAFGGAFGGAAGGLIGGQFGFGLSLVGTQLGTIFDQLVSDAAALGQALGSITADVNAIVAAAGRSNTVFAKNIKAIEKAGLKNTALALATQELSTVIGSTGVNALQQFGSDTQRLGQTFAKVMTQMQSNLAKLVNASGALAFVSDRLEEKQLFELAKVSEDPRVVKAREQFNKARFSVSITGAKQVEPLRRDLINIQRQVVQEEARNIENLSKQALADKKNLDEANRQLTLREKSAGLSDTLLKFTKQQEDARKTQLKFEEQRNKVVTNYEKGLANLRLTVENQISTVRLSNLRKANQLENQRQANELARLRNEQASADLLSFGPGVTDPALRKEAESLKAASDAYAVRVVEIEQKRARIQRDSALTVQELGFRADRFKLDVARQSAELALNAQNQIKNINDQIVQQNSKLTAVKFEVERDIAFLRLNVLAREAQLQKQILADKRKETTEAGPQQELEQQITDLSEFINKVKQTRDAIKDVPAPTQLTPVQGIKAASVSLDKYNTAVKASIQLERDFTQARLDSLSIELEAAGLTRLKASADILKAVQDEANTALAERVIQQQRSARVSELTSQLNSRALAEEIEKIENATSLQIRRIDLVARELEAQKIALEAKTILNEAEEEQLKKILELLEQIAKVRGAVSKAAQGQITAAKTKGGELNEFIQRATDELNNLEAVGVRVAEGIGNAIGNSLANGISSLIEGSASVKEVFADMLKSIGNTLVQEGARMIATYIAIGIAKAFAGLSGGTPDMGSKMSNTQYFNPTTGLGVAGPNFGLANGGPAKAGQPYMVGERGPELFVPSNNGGVMRNEDMRQLMGRSPVGNAPAMNFTFETTNIGGQEFVSREQLEAAMATTRRQAANDGAKRGMNMTLDRMQNSPRTRARVGIS